MPKICRACSFASWVKADTRQEYQAHRRQATCLLGLLCRQELPVYQRCLRLHRGRRDRADDPILPSRCPVIARPKNLATDVSTTEHVILHFMSLVDFDIVATIQATSPLVSSTDLNLAMEQFLREGSDSLLTGVPVRRFFWSIDGRPLNYDPFHRPFTQNFQGSIMENGAFYLTRRHILETYRNRLGGKVGIFRMAEETAVEYRRPRGLGGGRKASYEEHDQPCHEGQADQDDH